MTETGYAIIATLYEYDTEIRHCVKKSDWELACVRVYRLKENAETECIRMTVDFCRSNNLCEYLTYGELDFITTRGRQIVDVFVSIARVHDESWPTLWTGNLAEQYEDEQEMLKYGGLVSSVFREMDQNQASELAGEIKLNPFRVIKVEICP